MKTLLSLVTLSSLMLLMGAQRIPGPGGTAPSGGGGTVIYGKTTIGSSGAELAGGGFVAGIVITTGTDALGYSAPVCSIYGSQPTNLQCAIYLNSTLALICSSSSVSTGAGLAGWWTITPSSCGTLLPSTAYYMTVNASGGGLYAYYDSTGTYVDYYANGASVTFGTWPNPLTSTTLFSGVYPSEYLTLTAN